MTRGCSMTSPLICRELRTSPLPVSWRPCPFCTVVPMGASPFLPVVRKLFMVDPVRDERPGFTLPWHPEPLGTDAPIAYIAEPFAKEKPLGVGLKCASDRVWSQSFERSHPLGYGPLGRP